MQKTITDFKQKEKTLRQKRIEANNKAWKALGFKNREEGMKSVKIKKNKKRKNRNH